MQTGIDRLKALGARVRALFARRSLDADLDEEIRAHIEMATEEYLREGMSPEAAARRARRDFGGVDQVKDRHRRVRSFGWLEDLVRDVRFGVRSLLKRPSFAAMAVGSLAIGIGANTAIYTLVDQTVYQNRQYEEPERLVSLYEVQPGYGESTLSLPNVEDLRAGTRDVFSGLAVSTWTPAQVEAGSGGGGVVESVFAEVISGDYFTTLGVDAHLGRTILPEDDLVPGGHPVVMLGYGYWRDRFGEDPQVVGRELEMSGRSFTIIGVAPEDHVGGLRGVNAHLFAPQSMLDEIFGASVRDNRSNHMSMVTARLAPGVTVAEAEAAIAGVAADLDISRPAGWEPGEYFTLHPTSDVILFPQYDPYVRAAAFLLMGMVALILLLACANLASFLLARGVDRRREVAMRLALGASRRELVRQLLTESLLLGMVSGAVGLALAIGTMRLISGAELPLAVPISLALDPNWNVLAFTAAVSVATGVVLGLLPALQSTRPDVAGALRSERSAGGSRRQQRWRSALVGAQLALSLVLLVGAGLFLRSFQAIQRVEPGFGQDPGAVLSVMTPETRFDLEEARLYSEQLAEEFSRIPAVEAVGRSDSFPMSGLGRSDIEVDIDGHEPPAGQDWFNIAELTVDGAFFHAAGIPIVAGRGFDERDRHEGPPVVVVSRAMAERYWPEEGAVGQMLRGTQGGEDMRVVGVAGDIKLYTLGEAPRPIVYQNLDQADQQVAVVFTARTSDAPDRTLLSMTQAGQELDPDLWIYSARTVGQIRSSQQVPARISAFLLSGFGVLALVLAAIGLYGVVSYAVATRTAEVGVRMAMGADRSDIVRLLVGGGMRLLLLAGGVGLVLAVLVGQLLRSLLFGVGPLDVAAFAVAPAVLAGVAILAALLPALRASRLNPVTALRME